MQSPDGLERMLGALLRVPFQAINARIAAELARAGINDLRPAHFSVFQHLDAEGTRTTTLAERAQMTKQAMGELVTDLERRDYVVRVPDPTDRRAKLVVRTERGWAVETIARATVRAVELEWETEVGSERMRQFRETLEQIAAAVGREGL
ncbi:MAG TPA: MarR family winged helix-turn-helix transcriptional regulator [Chloroflexota bacterium]|nr:MarR family winged helix-turn-helix transcriptional regulator [Chloroflexota bacterium]